MKDFNRAILVGRLGADPVLRETKNGVKVANFPVATSSWRKSSGEPSEAALAQESKQSETQWHRVVAWGKQAEICGRFCRKGSTVLIEGEIRSHSYTLASGEERWSHEIHAEAVHFMGRKPEQLPVPAPVEVPAAASVA